MPPAQKHDQQCPAVGSRRHYRVVFEITKTSTSKKTRAVRETTLSRQGERTVHSLTLDYTVDFRHYVESVRSSLSRSTCCIFKEMKHPAVRGIQLESSPKSALSNSPKPSAFLATGFYYGLNRFHIMNNMWLMGCSAPVRPVYDGQQISFKLILHKNQNILSASKRKR